MDAFFNPTSVAVIGVSERPSNLGRNIMANLFEFAFDGLVYAVGQRGGKILGHRIYRSISDIPDRVDLAVILTPADAVAGILDECGQKGVRHAIIESAGFGEFGEEGKRRERRVREVAKRHGIRFIGPNCIGTMNLHSGLVLPFVQFHDVFARGRVSIVSQSGGVAYSFLNLLSSEGIGIAKIASIGNKLDVDENDLIDYLLGDDGTDIIIVYLEGISDGRRLMRLAASSAKPILLHKANIGALGRSIAASHTAALSSDDAVVDAALAQAGIARFRDRATLVDSLKILPLPRIRGRRLAILSRSGGQAIVAADAAETSGFALAPFRPEFIREIESHVRAKVIRFTNPLDLGDLFDFDVYLKIIERTVREADVDGVVFLHAYFSATEGEASRRLIEKTRELSFASGKPICVCVATDEEEVTRLRKNLEQPVFTSPIEVIKALELSRDFSFGARAPAPRPADVPGGRERAEGIVAQCRREKRSPLVQEGLSIFEAYGIPVIATEKVATADEAAEAAERLGFPVVVKVASRDVSHKTDIGGVQLNLRDGAQVRSACGEMVQAIGRKAPAARIEGFVVQPMLRGGWEVILGARRDPNFGPVVLVGMGGIFVEVFRDVAMRIVPFPEEAAQEMLRELKGHAILKGARSGRPYDTAAIVSAVMRLAALIDQNEEIQEIDINPFFVLPEGEGGRALDARVVLDRKFNIPVSPSAPGPVS